MKRNCLLVGVLALVMLSTVAVAGEATAEDMQNTIQELKARLATLEKDVARQKNDDQGARNHLVLAENATARRGVGGPSSARYVSPRGAQVGPAGLEPATNGL